MKVLTCACFVWVCTCVVSLQGQMRWIVAQKNRVRNGELYRFIADSKGAFVQVGQLSWGMNLYMVFAGSFRCCKAGCWGLCCKRCKQNKSQH